MLNVWYLFLCQKPRNTSMKFGENKSCFWGVLSYNFYISEMVILLPFKSRAEYYQKCYHRKNEVV